MAKVNSKFVNNAYTNSLTKKKNLIVIFSVLAFIVLGLIGGVVYYYVTFGELPVLSDSSAGEVKVLYENGKKMPLPSACSAKIMRGSDPKEIKNLMVMRKCPTGQVWSDELCGCTTACNVKLKCPINMVMDSHTCQCVCASEGVVCPKGSTFDTAKCGCTEITVNKLTTCSKALWECTITSKFGKQCSGNTCKIYVDRASAPSGVIIKEEVISKFTSISDESVLLLMYILIWNIFE